MEPPLSVDKDDLKWKLLAHVLKIFDSRRIKQVVARCGITPVDKAGVYTRIAIVAMYFQVDISYVVRELKGREELRRLAGVAEAPGAMAVYRFIGRYTAEESINMALKVLNTVCRKPGRDKTVIADCTDVALDLN